MRALFAATIIFFLGAADVVWGQGVQRHGSNCGPYPALVARLQENYGEVPIWRAMTQQGQSVFEFWVSPEGSWTIVQRNSNGHACIRGSGTGWHAPNPPPPPGDDA